ncbi:hypothetical protein ACRW9N_00005 [Listeria aquatica]|uniref:hypothetical protein n=1 Tax=Listeria aquatica TaxID=1494960 RepID=UPI003EF38F4B
MKKGWIIFISLIVIIIAVVAIVGGKKYMDNKKEQITVEQQKNIAKKIVRSYENVSSITFLKYYKDEKTGSVGINFELNGNKEYRTGVVVNDVSKFNTSEGILGLSPISKFEKLGISNNSKDSPVSLENVDITYLGE